MNVVDELLTKANLTTARLGQLLGVDTETVRLWRVEKRLPRNASLRERLARMAAEHGLELPPAIRPPIQLTVAPERNFIREIRRLNGWTQARMAQELGISFPSVQKLEASGHTPKAAAAYERLVKLGRKSGVDVQEVRPLRIPKVHVAPGSPSNAALDDSDVAPPFQQAEPSAEAALGTRRAALRMSREDALSLLLQNVVEEYTSTGQLSTGTLEEISRVL